MKQTTPRPVFSAMRRSAMRNEAHVQVVQPLLLGLPHVPNGAVRLGQLALLIHGHTRESVVGGVPRMTSTGVSCFTRSARSRSSSNSGKGSGFCVLGSQPVSALVRNTPGPLVAVVRQGRVQGLHGQADLGGGATTKGAGIISKPNTRCVAACFTRAPVSAPRALAPQVGGDALQRFGQVGPGASAGVEDVDVLGGQPVLNAQVVLSSGLLLELQHLGMHR